MSLAEKKMREDVIRFRKTTEDLVKEIKKVENEIAYMIKEHISVQTTCLPHKQAYLPEQKRKILQEELKKMTARIASMKANINRLNDIIKACHDVSLN
ncbi:hypothetical protein J6590_009190 [Homalodisca vitripennis]|nr:hypothetical protein J6590_009190 [Homalodisca vitripennis]